ncbi:MAG: ATP-binding protein [Bacteroidetes bacterium]|nr:ATP-binding protein [Bacteroidota bacterium]
MLLKTRNLNKPLQYFISIGAVVLISLSCFYSVHFIGYRVVALILLITVSLLAMMFDIFPVLIAAILSALIWNFFFIPPLFTLHVDNAEDLLMFLMYFLIAILNTVLTFKIRKAETKARDKEEKENTIKLYNTLLNSLSHELRTPISAIFGAVDMLKENKDKLSPENQIELINEIDKASIRLNRQVENLLNMSRIETGVIKLKLDWNDINELIFNVIQKISSYDIQHKIEFLPSDNLPLFKLDAVLIEEVLYNIIQNAIQHTAENSIIKINAMYDKDNCVICIADNGKGFPETEIKYIFDKFYRLPQTKTGGTGLGLSIVKGFVEAHNGKVKLENIECGGAKFTIELAVETSFINNLKNE